MTTVTTDLRSAGGHAGPRERRRCPSAGGALIVNADDWGRTPETTDRILECVEHAAVSSVSAMVFMEDSARAAALAADRGIDAGLHVNFTTPFSGARCPARLADDQRALGRCLRRSRFAPVLFHPRLAGAFEHVLAAQVEEFHRLYGRGPERFDGHHHMHLCTNVLAQKLLPGGAVVRRSFSFQAGEKSWLNRSYRRVVDRGLARRHRMADFFFSLAPLEPEARRHRILALARVSIVEVETHPVDPAEHRLLTSGEWLSQTRELRRLAFSAVPWPSRGRGGRP